MSHNTLVVLTRDIDHFRTKLSQLDLPDLDIIVPASDEERARAVLDATILLANPPMASKYINIAKNVVWMQSTFAGIDAMNDPVLRKDYMLTNVRDVYGEAMAEYVFAYLLFIERDIAMYREHQQQKVWQQNDVRMLRGKTICVLGAGSIGKCIAKIAQAFGMETLGYRTNDQLVEYFDEIFSGEGLRNCLSRADYVISVLPRTLDTNDIINAKTIACMKPSTVFINIGRGNAVNEQDVIQALREKKIAKAILDVFNQEPLPIDSPLWSLENVYITPHISGYILNDKIFDIFVENYERFLHGEELMYRVDFTKGY